MENKNKTTAAFLALFLGAYSAHYFYLGKSEAKKRLILALLTFGVMATVYFVKGIIDAVHFFKMTDDEFVAYCNDGDCAVSVVKAAMSPADRNKALLEFKKLMDDGAITAEEFARIKSKLMEA